MHSKKNHSVFHPPTVHPLDLLRFVQLDPFPRQWGDLNLTDEDLNMLEILIMTSLEAGVVIPGTNGLRKLRLQQINVKYGKKRWTQNLLRLLP